MKTTHSIRRALALTLAAITASSAVSAFAEAGPVRTVYDAGLALAYETPNVTLDLSLSVARSGEVFKTVQGHYIRDYENDDVTMSFSTVRPNGSSYDSTWHVTGFEGTAYSVDSLGAAYYSMNSYPLRMSVLSREDRMFEMLRLSSSAMSLLDPLLAPYITYDTTEAGSTAAVSFKGEMPEFVNDLAARAIRYAAGRFMGINILTTEEEEDYEEDGDGRGFDVLYFDEDRIFDVGYEKLYGVPFDNDTFWNEAWTDEKDQQIEEVWGFWNDIVNAAAQGHEDGCVFVFEDATAAWFETYEEALLAGGQRVLEYEDDDAAFLHYLAKRTGDHWDMDTLEAAWYGGNWELTEAVLSLYSEMDAEYRAMLTDGAAGYVRADGSLEMIPDLKAFWERQWEEDPSFSIAYVVLNKMRQVRIDGCDLVFTLDGEGRLSGADGTVEMAFIDRKGNEEAITLNLSFKASAYGESVVKPFDPEAYHVVSFSEWMSKQNYEETEAEPIAITSVTLDGVTYSIEP
ncbi:MAG: hypothetical protein IJ174_03165 [Clostridia bacterium]|nr:hypothetical protein [Clostridia bacterium]